MKQIFEMCHRLNAGQIIAVLLMATGLICIATVLIKKAIDFVLPRNSASRKRRDFNRKYGRSL